MALGTLGRADLAISATGTMAYTSGTSGGGPRELAWVSREGVITRVDTTWRAAMSQLAVSPDGRRVAFRVSSNEGSEIWVKELDRGPAARISFGSAINRDPSWSPDSRELVFIAGTDVSSGVMRGPADGSVLPHRIRPFPSGGGNAHLSPDGRWLIIEDGVGNIAAARTSGDTGMVELLKQPSFDVRASLSPDGRWLAYLSQELGQSQLFVRPFPDVLLAKRVVSTETACFPARHSLSARGRSCSMSTAWA